MTQRKRAIRRALRESDIVVADRSIDEDVLVLSAVWRQLDMITAAEFSVIEELGAELQQDLPSEICHVYCSAPVDVLWGRVKTRGLAVEAEFDYSLLRQRQASYEKWQRGLVGRVLRYDTEKVEQAAYPHFAQDVADEVSKLF